MEQHTEEKTDVLRVCKDTGLMIKTIRVRRSKRTYEEVPLEDNHIQLIKDYLNTEELMKGKFGKKFRIEFLQNLEMKNNAKIGTYGYVKGAQAFLICISENDLFSIFDSAYVFHGLVLLLTYKGLGTCWLGGIFNQDSVNASTSINMNEIIPAITPVGYLAAKDHFFQKVAKRVLKPKNRKPVEEIAYFGDFNTPFINQDEVLREAIYLGTLAPNAQNKQPWRIVVSEDFKTVHMYVEFGLKKQVHNKFRGYACPPEYLDIAIFYKQFEIAMRNKGIEGKLLIEEPRIKLPHDNLAYIVSWKIDN